MARAGYPSNVAGSVQCSVTGFHSRARRWGSAIWSEVSHGRYVAFQMAEVAVTRNMFAEIPATDCGTAAAATPGAGVNGPAA